MDKKTLNVGLVGYKFMGKAHSNAYQRVGMFFDASAKIRMKAICGREEEWVKRSAEKFGWEETTAGQIAVFERSIKRRPDVSSAR